MDTKQIVLHAFAFILAFLPYAVALFLGALNPKSPDHAFRDTKFSVAVTVTIFMVSIGEVLICLIFWRLATKEVIEDESVDEIPEDAPFDTEADLMADIWN